jgi:hypothetical protein
VIVLRDGQSAAPRCSDLRRCRTGEDVRRPAPLRRGVDRSHLGPEAQRGCGRRPTAPAIVRNRAAVTDPQEIGALLRAIDGFDGHPTTAVAGRRSLCKAGAPGYLARHSDRGFRESSRVASTNSDTAEARRSCVSAIGPAGANGRYVTSRTQKLAMLVLFLDGKTSRPARPA